MMLILTRYLSNSSSRTLPAVYSAAAELLASTGTGKMFDWDADPSGCAAEASSYSRRALTEKLITLLSALSH